VAYQVFDERGNFALQPETLFQSLARIRDDHTDDKLFDLIKKLEKDNKACPLLMLVLVLVLMVLLDVDTKQGKVIPGCLKIKTTPLDEKDLPNLAGRLDPSLVPVQPAGSDVRLPPHGWSGTAWIHPHSHSLHR